VLLEIVDHKLVALFPCHALQNSELVNSESWMVNGEVAAGKKKVPHEAELNLFVVNTAFERKAGNKNYFTSSAEFSFA
jgi:hypothetical protein